MAKYIGAVIRFKKVFSGFIPITSIMLVEAEDLHKAEWVVKTANIVMEPPSKEEPISRIPVVFALDKVDGLTVWTEELVRAKLAELESNG